MLRRLKRLALFLTLILGVIPSYFMIIGCSAFFPDEKKLNDRLAMVPTQAAQVSRDVTIHWSDRQIPFIEASNDNDLAFGVGVAHGHLRMTQLAVMKRIAYGRLGEIGGPFTKDVDRILRTVNYPKAAKESYAQMSEKGKAWLNGYVAGLNYVQNNTATVPPEYSLMNLKPEPWTTLDILAMGRVGGTDVNWLAWFNVLPNRLKATWKEDWKRITAEYAAGGNPPITGNEDMDNTIRLLNNFNKAGSNSIAVAPKHSASGSALMINDPHLGLDLPNLWMIIGLKSPNYHAVGLMAPGLPFLGLGRNKHISWGGTNARMASSDLYDVAGKPIECKDQEIKNRLWADSTVSICQSQWGPILSDIDKFPAKEGERLALRWQGHEPSQEIEAFLASNRATNVQEFRQAFATYGVSAMNMLVATQTGDIAQVRAVHLPNRKFIVSDDLVLDPDNPEHEWEGYSSSMDLPMMLNPKEGYITSANSRPRDINQFAGVFFTTDHRRDRLAELVEEHTPLDLAKIRKLQSDVYFASGKTLAGKLVAQLTPVVAKGTNDDITKLMLNLSMWDGKYAANSKGAIAFEFVLYEIAKALYANKEGKIPNHVQEWSWLEKGLLKDLVALPETQRTQLLREALQAATKAAGNQTWGDVHREEVGHYLAKAPVVGGTFLVGEYPASGSRDTVLKRNHKLTNEKHVSDYGAQSRHISDMSDIDENYFVLFGGQDGWLGSDNFADQIPLWHKMNYIKVPLSMDKVRKQFKHKTVIRRRQ